MSDLDIRWQQRAKNFEKAFFLLKEAIEKNNLNELERNGLMQRFEFTIDLGWKVMKDYLQNKGFDFKPSPKETFRLAQQYEMIDYAQYLIDGLTIRNELSHIYDEEKFQKFENQIRGDIYTALNKLYDFFQSEGGF